MQLSSVFPLALFDTNGTNHSQLDALLKHGIGHVSALGLIGHKTPETLAKSVNAIQRFLVTETRLKIPAILHNEAMSRVVAAHFTAFPTSIGSPRRGTRRRWKRRPTLSGARCGRWAYSKRWRPSWTWPAMPVGGG
jgi:hypothetical protein